MEAPKKNEIKIELTPEVARGCYSNFTIISHSPNEFIFDFISVVPNMPQAPVQARVIMSPEKAKDLLFALRDNLTKYEAMFGEIERKMPKQGGNTGSFTA